MSSKRIIQSLVLGITLASLAYWQIGTRGQAGAQAAEENKLPELTLTPAIQDAQILDGWNQMSSRQDSIQVGDGMVVSGRILAEYILKNQIPVVWGSEAICGGSSCSRMYCTTDGRCSYEDGRPGIDPIYLNPSVLDQSVGMQDRLIGELAHEAFHRMRPFGAGMITQIEEYWAFYVNTQITGAGFPKFDQLDPMNPEQLQNWFYMNGLHGYLKLAPYPGSESPIEPVAQMGGALGSE